MSNCLHTGSFFIFVRLWVLWVVFNLVGSTIAWADGICHGRFLNPVTDINWNMVFPIRIAGVKTSVDHDSTDSPLTDTSAICVCPGRVLGIPTIGISVSFHEPLYLEEIARTPGCLSSLGDVQLLSGYQTEASELQESGNSVSRWQVHWYQYPVFSMLNVFRDFLCVDTGDYSLLYLSELDPTWQNDEWGAVYAPEAALFANATAQNACMSDTALASVHQPQDALFWCAGGWGSVYPLTGNTNAAVDRLQSANLAGAKMIARLAEMGLLWNTVGSQSLCAAQPMPVWVKSEFSIDPVYPVVTENDGLSIGEPPSISEYTPVETYPEYENINQVIFQEQQCCIRP